MHGVLILLAIFTASTATMKVESPNTFHQTGVASWYGAECSKTASGERYNPNSLTCAHRSLPFGTMVQVRNLENGRSVVLRVNNRGPYCKRRILDMSKVAARELDIVKAGTARVELAVVK